MRVFGAAWTVRHVAAVALAVAVAAVTGWAGLVHLRLQGRPAPEQPAARAAAAASGMAAMRVARDPETGELGMPSAADASAFEPMQEPAAEPRVETLPNGMMILHHDKHFRNYALAYAGADGRVVADCAAGADAARPKCSRPRAAVVPRDTFGLEVQ